MNELVIKNSPLKYLILLPISIGFVLGGLFMLHTGGNPAVAWMSIIFFGSGIPLFIFQMLDTRPKLVINDMGITDRRNRAGTVPWSNIQSVFTKNVGKQTFLCVRMKDENMFINKLSPMQKNLVEINRGLGFTPFSIGLSQLRLDPSQIEDLVNKFLSSRG